MKKVNYLVVVLPLLVGGCFNSSPSKKKTNTNPTIDNPSSVFISNSSTSESSDSLTSGTSITSQTSNTSSSKTSQSTNTNQSSNTQTASGDDYMSGREILPCGYVKLDKPTNSPISITTSNDSSDWWQEDIKDELPSDMCFIYGNSSSNGPSGHYANAPMYSYNESDEDQYPGGLKITKRSQGLQSPLFTHSGEKLEIRIGISQVNNANGTPEKNKPTGYLYFYNSNGDFLSTKTIEVEEGSIVTSTKYLRYYVLSAQEIAYFEFRLNAQPYKNSQNYNFGIGYLSIHSWPQA